MCKTDSVVEPENFWLSITPTVEFRDITRSEEGKGHEIFQRNNMHFKFWLRRTLVIKDLTPALLVNSSSKVSTFSPSWEYMRFLSKTGKFAHLICDHQILFLWSIFQDHKKATSFMYSSREREPSIYDTNLANGSSNIHGPGLSSRITNQGLTLDKNL